MMPLKITMARVAEIKKQLVQLNDRHRTAIDASDWEMCAKIQEQIARKLDQVKTLMQTSERGVRLSDPRGGTLAH